MWRVGIQASDFVIRISPAFSPFRSPTTTARASFGARRSSREINLGFCFSKISPLSLHDGYRAPAKPPVQTAPDRRCVVRAGNHHRARR